ncbi:hypothetical protein PVK06_000664 [Gossypium arboreum]|uniref:Uncharacterized protein n=1 Tax=Gossypium arboreum TaxID=29729 RepID=A0ABR0QYZ0_GOSAR|nr:hypothetical protein PVK06_000664 [Gossypium arboreum]
MKGKISAKFARRYDEDVETIVTIYCPNGMVNTEYVQLFAKLTDVEPVEDVIPLTQHYEIHPVMIETDLDGEDGFDNNDDSDNKGEDFSDPNVDEVPNDIDNECVDDDENVYAHSIKSLSHGTVARNSPGSHISSIDPDASHAFEFPEYPNIISAH